MCYFGGVAQHNYRTWIARSDVLPLWQSIATQLSSHLANRCLLMVSAASGPLTRILLKAPPPSGLGVRINKRNTSFKPTCCRLQALCNSALEFLVSGPCRSPIRGAFLQNEHIRPALLKFIRMRVYIGQRFVAPIGTAQ
jgi:hypothetical protein